MSYSQLANKVNELCAENDIWYLESTLCFPKESIDEVKQVHEEGFFIKHRGGDSKGWQSCALHGWGIGDRAEYYRTMNPSGYGFEEKDATFYEYENCSLITSIFTLQFIPKSKREDLLQKVYDGLNCGGAYIFAEKTICENALVQDMITFNYYDYKRESFTTEDIMDKERTLRNMMKPNTWKEIEDMILSAGFNTVQPFWRNHAFVGALAIK